MSHAAPHEAEDTASQFAMARRQSQEELTAGLMRPQATIAPKYFYDTQGSKLFEAICALEEYYPTRTEFGIFRRHGAAIAAAAGPARTLIDLGAGNCAKAAALLGVLRPRAYVPVDISTSFLRQAVAPLAQEFPDLPIHPVACDFSDGFGLPPLVRALPRKLFFYPGSSLGNFAPPQALRFLQSIHQQGADLLLGLDLIKDESTIKAAYDDQLGVTAAFNLNILRHANRVLGADFVLADWAHHVIFNTDCNRIEMHLRARRAVSVRWPGGVRAFGENETIHTEDCHKFTRESAADMLSRAGFGQVTYWTDQAGKFLVCHARAN